jgi:uncharacterized membrane protein (DUF373 family)
VNEPEPKSVRSILKWSGTGKRVVAGVLMAMMFLLVGVVTIEIVYAFVRATLPGTSFAANEIVISEADLLAILGLFLSVLIALELIETVEVYFRRHSIHVEIVVLVAIIALARKVIILDLTEYDSLMLFALGFLILALGATYFFVRKAAPAEE